MKHHAFLVVHAHVYKRIGVLLVMMGLLIVHFLKIWVFAIAYMIVEHGKRLKLRHRSFRGAKT